MISIHHAGAVYLAALSHCYDGDTCTVSFPNFPPLVAEQSLRFDGFDTPEIRGGCPQSKKLARQAQAVTEDYMFGNVRRKALAAKSRLAVWSCVRPICKRASSRKGWPNSRPIKSGKIGAIN